MTLTNIVNDTDFKLRAHK